VILVGERCRRHDFREIEAVPSECQLTTDQEQHLGEDVAQIEILENRKKPKAVQRLFPPEKKRHLLKKQELSVIHTCDILNLPQDTHT
jgi:hypothetical protein